MMLTATGVSTGAVVAAIGDVGRSAVGEGWTEVGDGLLPPPQAASGNVHAAVDRTGEARQRRTISRPSADEMSAVQKVQWLERRDLKVKMSPLPAAGLLLQPKTDWIASFAPARGSWHGLSIEDAVLAIVGIVFVLVLLCLTAGDPAD
jgi:hypothetical protein